MSYFRYRVESCLVLWPSRVKGLPPLSNLAKAPTGASETNAFGHFANYANAESGFEGFLSVVVYGKKWVYCARKLVTCTMQSIVSRRTFKLI